jgi:signal peptidase II
MSRRVRIFSIAAVLTLVSDQLTKLWAREALEYGHAPVPFFGGFWSWELSFNTGSAFGLFQSVGGARWFLTIIGFIACGAILYILRKTENDRGWIAAALGLVFGGALGNVIDRILFGKVTDFVLWHVRDFRWPAFNIADAALVAGVIILFFDIGKKKEPKRKKV